MCDDSSDEIIVDLLQRLDYARGDSVEAEDLRLSTAKSILFRLTGLDERWEIIANAGRNSLSIRALLNVFATSSDGADGTDVISLFPLYGSFPEVRKIFASEIEHEVERFSGQKEDSESVVCRHLEVYAMQLQSTHRRSMQESLESLEDDSDIEVRSDDDATGADLW